MKKKENDSLEPYADQGDPGGGGYTTCGTYRACVSHRDCCIYLEDCRGCVWTDGSLYVCGCKKR